MDHGNHYVRAGFTASAAFAASLAAMPAGALEPDSWYIGGSSDETHIEVWRGFGWETSDDQGGFSLHGGVNVSRRVDVEFGASRATSLQWSEYLADLPGYLTSHNTFDATSLSVSAVIRLNRSEDFNVYFKGGMAWSRLSGQQTLDTLYTDAALTRGMSGSGTDYLLGGGLAVKVTPHWRLRFEYQFFGVDAGPLGVRDDTTVDSFSMGVDYRLGRRSRAVSNDAPVASR